MKNTEPNDCKKHFTSFALFLRLVLSRCAEFVLVKIFLPPSKNGDRVKQAAGTLSALTHEAVQGDRDAMGELVLLATLAANYTAQAARVQTENARYHARLTPAWPIMMFRNSALNRLNERFLEQLRVGSQLQISSKTLKGLADGSAGLAALLKIFLEIRRALKRKAAAESDAEVLPLENENPPAKIEPPASIKSDIREAKVAYDESYRYSKEHTITLGNFGKPTKMKDEAYLKLIWRWMRRNRVKSLSR